MMLRTHVAIAIFFILLFLPSIESRVLFAVVALIATFLPDIDTGFSTIGRTTGAGIIRFFARHRGFLHSLSFCVIISFIFAFFLPVIALPFFLGYGLHLFTDSFTLEGIRPFWPSRKESRSILKTGSFVETIIFIIFLVVDIAVFIYIAGYVL